VPSAKGLAGSDIGITVEAVAVGHLDHCLNIFLRLGGQIDELRSQGGARSTHLAAQRKPKRAISVKHYMTIHRLACPAVLMLLWAVIPLAAAPRLIHPRQGRIAGRPAFRARHPGGWPRLELKIGQLRDWSSRIAILHFVVTWPLFRGASAFIKHMPRVS
jgi:hypothetical protein